MPAELTDEQIAQLLRDAFGNPVLSEAELVAQALSGALGRPASPEEVETGLYIWHQFRAILGRDPTPDEGQNMLARLAAYIREHGRPPSQAEIDAYLASLRFTAPTEPADEPVLVPTVLPPSCAPAATGAAQLPVYGDCAACPPGYAYAPLETHVPRTAPVSELICDPPAAPTLSSDMAWRLVDPTVCTWQRLRAGNLLVPGVYEGQVGIVYPQTALPERPRLAGQRLRPGSRTLTLGRQLGAEAPVQTGWCLRVSEPAALPDEESAAAPSPITALTTALSPFRLPAGGSGVGGWIAAHPWLTAGGAALALYLGSQALGKGKRTRA